mmetsp:Transcript_3609/g.12534  ORF Transcript_3609/g.12534 Transcript_3609/m.12534 type:complete len:218 (-) Transcript_3609:503-1156(-)
MVTGPELSAGGSSLLRYGSSVPSTRPCANAESSASVSPPVNLNLAGGSGSLSSSSSSSSPPSSLLASLKPKTTPSALVTSRPKNSSTPSVASSSMATVTKITLPLCFFAAAANGATSSSSLSVLWNSRRWRLMPLPKMTSLLSSLKGMTVGRRSRRAHVPTAAELTSPSYTTVPSSLTMAMPGLDRPEAAALATPLSAVAAKTTSARCSSAAAANSS